MSKGKSAAVIVSLLFVVGLFVGYRTINQTEPSYQGKSVSAWLETSIYEPQLKEALKAMGTNAAPYIICRLRNTDSPWRTKYGEFFQRLPNWLVKVLPQPSTYDYFRGSEVFCDIGPTVKPLLIKSLKDRSHSVRTASASALFMLNREGTNITDAIPSLTESLLDKDEDVRFYATMAIGSIGSDAYSAVPALIQVLETKTNSNLLITFYAQIMEIRTLGHIGSRAKSALPRLKELLEDKDLKVEAALAIWRIEGDVTNTLPILIEGFNREREPSLDLIDGLGEIGPPAKSAVPRMKDFMAGSEDQLDAAIAIWRIEGDVTNTLPVLIECLKQGSEPPVYAIEAIREMGPRADAAVPVLLKELNLGIPDFTRQKILDALKQIDPDAAAKAGVK